MKLLLHSRMLGAFTALSLLALAPAAFSQEFRAKVDEPTITDLQSPDVSVGGSSKSFKPKEWLEMEAKVELDARPKDTEFADSFEVVWHILVKNPEQSGTFYKLERKIKHVNIPVGEDVYISAYLSPSTIRRLTGSERAGASSVESVGVEVLVNGARGPESVATTKEFGSKKDWWTINSSKVALVQNYKILSKAETPFSFLWWDRYAEVDVEQR